MNRPVALFLAQQLLAEVDPLSPFAYSLDRFVVDGLLDNGCTEGVTHEPIPAPAASAG